MKKVLLCLLVLSGMGNILSAGDFYATFGVPVGWIRYNQSEFNDTLGVKPEVGFSLGVEYIADKYSIGIRYAQRGSGFDLSEFYDLNMVGTDRYNYVDIYSYYKYPVYHKTSIIGGLQLGIPVNSDWVVRNKGEWLPEDGGDIHYSDVNPDFGLLLGLDYRINKDFCASLCYYRGLIQLYNSVDPNYNAQNRSIMASLKYKIRTDLPDFHRFGVKIKEYQTENCENFIAVFFRSQQFHSGFR